ncbi:Pimeloyl-ACP methyl ester carboxylesterase [Natronorubrum sediminis]|uniref:Pimeloyl-ACP methyl ester carboxylesterase n=1 Tax=Natronorubrum sediminis TaxID=640943 RepID=A0A1H6G370_9EURY|nr:alpha/beta hydrolase [Natronorubrum sediminis]SEH17499.1 Pimeloyl-ACP methyl ester carboxylesterase [Natronorubrum sediminis]
MTGTGVATVRGCRLSYRRAGTSGPPIVLCHGAGVDDASISWRHTVDALAEDYRVYAPDWPGYGESTGDVTHTTESYVDVLEGFVETIPGEMVSLVGISMGGGVALGYALEHPDRVDRLALVDSYGLGEKLPSALSWKLQSQVPGMTEFGKFAAGVTPGTARLVLDNLVADASELPEPFVEDVRTKLREPGSMRAFSAFQRNELAFDGRVETNYVDDLESLSIPTLLVHGKEDPLVPPEWSVRAADRIPNATLEIVDDCGHWAPRERPEAFNERLMRWLSETRTQLRDSEEAYPKAGIPGVTRTRE